MSHSAVWMWTGLGCEMKRGGVGALYFVIPKRYVCARARLCARVRLFVRVRMCVCACVYAGVRSCVRASLSLCECVCVRLCAAVLVSEARVISVAMNETFTQCTIYVQLIL